MKDSYSFLAWMMLIIIFQALVVVIGMMAQVWHYEIKGEWLFDLESMTVLSKSLAIYSRGIVVLTTYIFAKWFILEGQPYWEKGITWIISKRGTQ